MISPFAMASASVSVTTTPSTITSISGSGSSIVTVLGVSSPSPAVPQNHTLKTKSPEVLSVALKSRKKLISLRAEQSYPKVSVYIESGLVRLSPLTKTASARQIYSSLRYITSLKSAKTGLIILKLQRSPSKKVPSYISQRSSVPFVYGVRYLEYVQPASFGQSMYLKFLMVKSRLHSP